MDQEAGYREVVSRRGLLHAASPRHLHAHHAFQRELRARRVEPAARRSRNRWIDLRSGKEHEIETEHAVGLTFVDASQKAYLSITARAEVIPDHAEDCRGLAIYRRDLWW